MIVFKITAQAGARTYLSAYLQLPTFGLPFFATKVQKIMCHLSENLAHQVVTSIRKEISDGEVSIVFVLHLAEFC